MEHTINTLSAILWLIVALLCLVGAIFFGAWWHLCSAGFCLLLFFSYLPADKQEEK